MGRTNRIITGTNADKVTKGDGDKVTKGNLCDLVAFCLLVTLLRCVS